MSHSHLVSSKRVLFLEFSFLPYSDSHVYSNCINEAIGYSDSSFSKNYFLRDFDSSIQRKFNDPVTSMKEQVRLHLRLLSFCIFHFILSFYPHADQSGRKLQQMKMCEWSKRKIAFRPYIECTWWRPTTHKKPICITNGGEKKCSMCGPAWSDQCRWNDWFWMCSM